MDSAYSVNHIPIRLTYERWYHIVENWQATFTMYLTQWKSSIYRSWKPRSLEGNPEPGKGKMVDRGLPGDIP